MHVLATASANKFQRIQRDPVDPAAPRPCPLESLRPMVQEHGATCEQMSCEHGTNVNTMSSERHENGTGRSFERELNGNGCSFEREMNGNGCSFEREMNRNGKLLNYSGNAPLQRLNKPWNPGWNPAARGGSTGESFRGNYSTIPATRPWSVLPEPGIQAGILQPEGDPQGKVSVGNYSTIPATRSWSVLPKPGIHAGIPGASLAREEASGSSDNKGAPLIL
eukprot:gene13463-biopygen6952